MPGVKDAFRFVLEDPVRGREPGLGRPWGLLGRPGWTASSHSLTWVEGSVHHFLWTVLGGEQSPVILGRP